MGTWVGASALELVTESSISESLLVKDTREDLKKRANSECPHTQILHATKIRKYITQRKFSDMYLVTSYLSNLKISLSLFNEGRN